MRHTFLRYIILCLPASFNLTVFSQVKKVDVVGITVSDMNRSLGFYTDVLGFEKINDHEYEGTGYEDLQGIFGLHMRVVRLRLGDEFIELTDYLTSGGRSIPEDAKSNDLSFQHIAIVVSDMDKAYSRLRKFNVEHVSTSPQTLPKSIPAAEGIKAFYFHDPDKHNLELIFFPKGKGQDKWQHPNGKIFLGIDHTAIGVSNTDSSLAFYRDLLGIERRGDSWNKGIEQSHLNYVENASLHITGLRAPAGPGIEFLEYLNPGPGKKYPEDSRTDDIWHWQTTLLVSNINEVFDQLISKPYKIISKGIITLSTDNGRTVKAFIVRDRDGHAMLIKETID